MIENDQMNMYLHGWLTQFFFMSFFFILQKSQWSLKLFWTPLTLFVFAKTVESFFKMYCVLYRIN